MGNLVPPNQKARDLKSTLEIILGIHFFVAILKMVVIGIFSGISDLFSCLILWCGLNSIIIRNFSYVMGF
jgi:hypothetical protein